MVSNVLFLRNWTRDRGDEGKAVRDFVGLLRSINRVAEVTYGERRVSSMGSEVKLDRRRCGHFGWLAGSLDRLDADQAVYAFNDKMRGPPPADRDVRTLDIAVSRYIRPTIDGMQRNFSQLSEELFGYSRQSSQVGRGARGVSGSGVLDPRRWESTKRDYIIQRGFKFSDDIPIAIEHRFELSDYTGGAGNLDLEAS